MNLKEIHQNALTLHDIPIDIPGTGQDGWSLVFNEIENKYEWVETKSYLEGNGINISTGDTISVDETELDASQIPFSATGFTATNIYNAILESGIESEHDAIKIQGIPVDAPITGDDEKLYQYNETEGKFELITIDGLEEVTPTNPITTLKDIYVEYLEDNTISTTTDQINWVQKVRLTFTPVEAGEYYVSWQIALANTGQNKGALAQLELDDTTIIGEAINAPIVAGSYNTASGFRRVTFDTNEHYVDVDFKAEAGTALAKDARVIIQRVKAII